MAHIDRRKRKFNIFLFAMSLVALPIAAASHDLKGYHNVVDQRNVASEALNATGALTPDSTFKPEFVIDTLAVWPKPHKLTICFIGGTTSLRKQVVGAMQRAWPLGSTKLAPGYLSYDQSSFSNPPSCRSTDPKTVGADIRVAFQANSGYWSYVGTWGLAFVPNMNFEGFDKVPPSDPTFTQLIAHEMGHALGLEHEHQSPALAQNCGWDYSWIWENYIWQSPQQMRENLDRLGNYVLANGLPRYMTSLYDGGSIMHYYFAAAAFVAGDQDICYIKQQANLPDTLDYASLAKMATLAPTQKAVASLISAVAGKGAGGHTSFAPGGLIPKSHTLTLLQLKANLLSATPPK